MRKRKTTWPKGPFYITLVGIFCMSLLLFTLLFLWYRIYGLFQEAGEQAFGYYSFIFSPMISYRVILLVLVLLLLLLPMFLLKVPKAQRSFSIFHIIVAVIFIIKMPAIMDLVTHLKEMVFSSLPDGTNVYTGNEMEEAYVIQSIPCKNYCIASIM